MSWWHKHSFFAASHTPPVFDRSKGQYISGECETPHVTFYDPNSCCLEPWKIATILPDTYTSHSWEYGKTHPSAPSPAWGPQRIPKGKHDKDEHHYDIPAAGGVVEISLGVSPFAFRGYFIMAGFMGKGGFHRLNLRPMDFRLLISRKHLDINKWIMEPMINSFSETTTIYNLHQLTSIYRESCGSATSSDIHFRRVIVWQF